MDDTTKIALASAVAGGYLLGRTKKGRAALTLALMLAGRGMSAQPRQLAGEAAQWLGEVPQVAQLKDQLRDEGTDAARRVMTSLTERGVGSLADAISDRTPGSVGVPGDAASQDEEQPEAESEREDDDEGGDDEEEYEAEDEAEDEDDSADQEPEGSEEPEEPEEPEEGTGEAAGQEQPRRSGGRRTAPRGVRASSRTKKTAKSAPAKKTATKKTAAKKTGSANRSSPRR